MQRGRDAENGTTAWETREELVGSQASKASFPASIRNMSTRKHGGTIARNAGFSLFFYIQHNNGICRVCHRATFALEI